MRFNPLLGKCRWIRASDRYLDEKWLIGEKIGEGFKREGGFGRDLGILVGGNFWFENVIEGVTDEVGEGGSLWRGVSWEDDGLDTGRWWVEYSG